MSKKSTLSQNQAQRDFEKELADYQREYRARFNQFESLETLRNPYTVRLRSVGNPDHGQYAPVSDPLFLTCPTLQAAVSAAMLYIESWDLGGGNWPTTWVLRDGVHVARIAYNGRVFDRNGKEIAL